MRIIKPIFKLLVFLVFLTTTASAQADTSKLKPIKKYQEYQSWSGDITAGIFLPLSYPLAYYGFGFFPRYNFFAPKDFLTISVGAPMNVGLDIFVSSAGSVIQYMTDIPLVLDFNLGNRATKFDNSPFGGFIGAGLDYNFMHLTYLGSRLNLHTFGPVIHGGFRWRVNGRETGVRVSYIQGFKGRSEVVNGIVVEGSPGNRIFSIAVLYGIN